MERAKVLATHGLFEAARKILDGECDVEYRTGAMRPTREELMTRIGEKDGLVCLLTEKIDEEVLRAAPTLRIVANVAVGYDNVDVHACTKRGIVVTNTPGVLDETTADLAWTLMMAVARRLGEAEQFARSGEWKNWDLDQLCGTDVWGKTLGIVGLGRIGQAMARRAAGFQMKVIYTGRRRAPQELEKAVNAEYRELDAMLGEADFVSLHVPLNAETRGMFDAEKFSKMKRSAFLINTARGPIVHEEDLVRALEKGIIAGAGLDVFEREPSIHPGLKRANVVLAPHLGSASVETRTKMACMAAKNVVEFFRGQRPANAVNPEVLPDS
jgi:glyoxylate reductase